MPDAADYIPALKYGNKLYPQHMVLPSMPLEGGKVWYVDGDKSAGGGGSTWEDAFATLVAAEAAASAGDVIYVAGRTMTKTDTDPISYTENLVIDTPQLSIIGVSRGRTQGGLPQIKVGTTTTSPLITVRAPGCLIANLGINGVGGTGGGIKLDDDGGTSKTAFATTIANCHFKNCVGTSATNATTGAAIMLTGAPWQILITGNRFWNNAGDIIATPTFADAKDVVIEDNLFSGPAAVSDCNIYMVGTSGDAAGLVIRNNVFAQLPAVGSGTNKRYVILTGYTGIMAGNTFGCLVADTGTTLTFLASTGTAGIVPTTVHMANNWGESATTTEVGYVGRGANT